jgi:hypothetical protein
MVKVSPVVFTFFVFLVTGFAQVSASESQHAHGAQTYLGFDRNDYPGDANLAALRKTFAFSGYWLNNPPGEHSNGWRGKRLLLEREGFGFLLLYNGRSYAQLKSVRNPGAADGRQAAHAAEAEGFRQGSVIFLDQEEGGRMLAEQKRYVFAWAEAVRQAGYRPGIYCSGIEIAEEHGRSISTARDLHDSAQGRELVFWVANDACPPSPGCTFPKEPASPVTSGAPFAEVWQFAQSPIRRQFSAACIATYRKDGDCYAPGLPSRLQLHLDVNTSSNPDPSHTKS